MAAVHERLGRAEHGVEERMLHAAHDVAEPEAMRERAHEISEAADRHLLKAAQLEGEEREEQRD